MVAAPPSPADVADEFFSLYHLVKRHVDTAMSRSGVPLQRSKMLRLIDGQNPSRASDLAVQLGTAPRTVTQGVDALERDGLVVRRPDPSDGRATLIWITAAGRKALKASRRPQRAAYDELFGALSDHERAALLRSLRKVRALTQ
jgi:DNA-binding MarR family transcriptional regulator